MARNEEKQLARLNRYYLQQSKEEELRKRPPRPKLETLCTLDDVKKWIPSILKDIEFYIKQMEVSCYPKKTIEEFEKRIDHLRGEYKAFVRKAHELEPDLSATPWSDRPYSGKRQKLNKDESESTTLPGSTTPTKISDDGNAQSSFVPISTPLLQKPSCTQFYGCRKPEYPLLCDIDDKQDQPLDFNFSATDNPGCNKLPPKSILPLQVTDKGSKLMTGNDATEDSALQVKDIVAKTKCDFDSGQSKVTNPSGSTDSYSKKQPQFQSHQGLLNIPYSDSSSDEDT